MTPPVLSPLFSPPFAKGSDVVVHWTKSLFRRDELDARLLAALTAASGRERNDYPLHILWEPD